MAISLNDKSKRKYSALIARVPEESKSLGEMRAKICASCRYLHDTTVECIKCDCAFKREFYLKDKKCPERMW
jgi:hypothetical protein